jgi:hypothetical protein
MGRHTADPVKFLHDWHLQFSPQTAPTKKHSQYFLRQLLLEQLHPATWALVGVTFVNI